MTIILTPLIILLLSLYHYTTCIASTCNSVWRGLNLAKWLSIHQRYWQSEIETLLLFIGTSAIIMVNFNLVISELAKS